MEETRVHKYARKKRDAKGTTLIVIGAVLCALTVINMVVGNRNLGVYLPAIMGLPLLLWGIFKVPLDKWFCSSKGARAVRNILIVLYVAVTCIFVTCGIWMGTAMMQSPQPGADAVIVLGAAVHGNEVTDTLRKRLDKAMEYWRDSPDSLIVVTGGMGSNENVSEAQAMHDYLMQNGIPEDVIIMEDKATSTRENFQYSRELLEDRFGTAPLRVVYVTNDFHLQRAGQEARKAGFTQIEGLGAPTPVLTIPGAWMRESAALMYNLIFPDRA